ncbi:MAG: hypothetical protein V4663_01075 [Bacteroidota bacterium]
MEDKIVIYRTFENPVEANIILTRLKDAGFNCFLSGENTMNLGFLFDSALSHIPLHIFESDLQAIEQFLAEPNEL